LAAYLFLMPNIIGFLTFTAFPVIVSFLLSFFHWELITPPKFAGTENYAKLFTEDRVFRQVIRNTLFYVGGYGSLNILTGLAMALWLCSIRSLKGLFRTIFFMPVLIPTVAAAFIWKFMYEPNDGLINALLGLANIEGPNWLGNPNFAMIGIILMSVWKGFGYNMVIFIAAIQAIPSSLVEAAKIDGANAFRRFLYVTLPMITPALFFVTVMTVIGSFQVFDQAFILTKGGPANATNTIVMYIYENGFEFFKMGYASAVAWVLFGFIFLLTMIQMKLQKRWVHYG